VNPDYYNSEGYIIWKIADSDGNTASFKVLDKGNVIITDETGGSFVVDKNNAREHWKVYMNRGFRLTNSSIIHDMKKFHNKYRELEKMEKELYILEKELEKKSWKDIHENDLQEMRIDPKDFIKKAIMECTNYALEA
tara:strand:- start:568 stop:978 length:411 start_codon:yes stop_codon:yes gene_type:complete